MARGIELRQVNHADYLAWMKERDGEFNGGGSGFGGGYFVVDSDSVPSNEERD